MFRKCRCRTAETNHEITRCCLTDRHLFMDMDTMLTHGCAVQVLGSASSQLRQRNVHDFDEEVCSVKLHKIVLKSWIRSRDIHYASHALTVDLTGVLFGEAQRRCYPEHVAEETTFPHQHTHICQKKEKTLNQIQMLLLLFLLLEFQRMENWRHSRYRRNMQSMYSPFMWFITCAISAFAGVFFW
jgi:hypothetical protein